MTFEGPKPHEAAAFEQELSPEQIEIIMAKIQDIDSEGLGYHAINASRRERQKFDKTTFQIILQNGLFDLKKSYKLSDDLEDKIIDEEQYKKENRSRYIEGFQDSARERGKNTHINNLFFNIIGKTGRNNYYPGDTQIANDNFFLYEDRIGIIFSLDGYIDYNELPEEKQREFDEKRLPINRVYNERKLETPVTAVIGYSGKIRIAPRNFLGIVFRLPDKDNVVEDEKDPQKYIEKAKSIAQAMQEVYQDTDRLLPIYDVHGNLWWPKQMSYNEIKKSTVDLDVLMRQS